MAKRAPERHAIRVGYLTSQYPATSHTFISREVAAVRARGLAVDTFSIRRATKAELKDAALAEEARGTFTVLAQPPTVIAGSHLRMFAGRPAKYLATLALAAKHRPPGFKALALSVAHFAEAVVLAHELHGRKVTRLHNHFANSGATVGYLAASLLNLPWSFTMHGISETDYPAGLMLGRKIAAAEFVACVSYFGRAQAMRLTDPAHWTKLRIVRCGLPLDGLPARAENPGRRRIICVGRLSPEKGQTGLLEAFAKVAVEQDMELLLVGDGPDRAQLEDRAAALGITTQVTFAGRCGEKATLAQIAASDILVLPSFMEGLPIVLMEAMALGTPVIASRVAGIPELVVDGESGLLFTPSDWDGLAHCLRRLSSDRALRERLASGGRSAVRDHFDIRRSAQVMVELFEHGSDSVDA